MSEGKTLERFLREHAEPRWEDWCFGPAYQYREDVNPDAADGTWLDKRTSYIYRVGVLAVIDANKCDFVEVHIGHQRDPDAPYEYIGKLWWQDGENDDIGRCLRRYIGCLDFMHPVFMDD